MEPQPAQGSSPKTEAFVRFHHNAMGLLNVQDPNDLGQYLWLDMAQWTAFFVTAQDVQQQKIQEKRLSIRQQT